MVENEQPKYKTPITTKIIYCIMSATIGVAALGNLVNTLTIRNLKSQVSQLEERLTSSRDNETQCREINTLLKKNAFKITYSNISVINGKTYANFLEFNADGQHHRIYPDERGNTCVLSYRINSNH
jgi:hypothetical protein